MKVLRALIVFSTVWMLASGAFVSASFADISSVTSQQVSNVCGKDLTTANGHSGCTKTCANGHSTCIYDCSQKTGDCNAVSIGLVSTGGNNPKPPKPGTILLHTTGQATAAVN
jgi:hypothetical protein